VQIDEDEDELIVPGGQCAHTDEPALVWKALAGHCAQVLLDVAPVALEYVEAGQEVQTELDVAPTAEE